ncbi:MAG: permease prefix domain 1-containing protein [Dysosmobacter sp.]
MYGCSAHRPAAVTDRERLAIQAELDAHIEDHMAALRELDYPPELAEERALAAMGDPVEVGRSSMRAIKAGSG